MIKYSVPATSANIGIGFDCLGLALDLYNTFSIEKSDDFTFEGFLNSNIDDNLFYIAYKETCSFYKDDIAPIYVKLDCNIPISRGLGSSSSLIVGGIYAYYLINNIDINKKTIQQIATKIEGHPDNVTPCIYGGLCVSYKEMISKYDISNKWKLYLIIPNYEVKTSDARKIIKQSININDAVTNIASALIGIDGLINYDANKVSLLNNDTLHEPYRKQLIHDYELCKEEAFKQGARAFLISGSGSSMLIISDKNINIELKDILFKEVKANKDGIICQKNY